MNGLQHTDNGVPTTTEKKAAEKWMMWLSQRNTCSRDARLLESGREGDRKKSKLYKLRPFKDDSGLWRAGTRLEYR